MNYLAHAYLSFGNPDILIGNLVADSVRGKQVSGFRAEVQQGIFLHRKIDEYTDKHSVTRRLKTVFSEVAGRYNASFLDISFDHFLALDSHNEPSEGWSAFTQSCYRTIDQHLDELPKNIHRLFGYMKEGDWLYNYRYGWMIKKSFEKLTERAVFLDNDTNVFKAFEDNYKELEDGYKEFFPDLKNYVIEIYPGNRETKDK